MDSQEKLLEFFVEPFKQLKEDCKNEKELVRGLLEKFNNFKDEMDKSFEDVNQNFQKFLEILKKKTDGCDIETKRVEQRVNALENDKHLVKQFAEKLKKLEQDNEDCKAQLEVYRNNFVDVNQHLFDLENTQKNHKVELQDIRDKAKGAQVLFDRKAQNSNEQLQKQLEDLDAKFLDRLNVQHLQCNKVHDAFRLKFEDVQRRFDDGDRRVEQFYQQLNQEVQKNKVVIDEEKIRLIVKKYKFQ